jgi:tetratricopeptide (TPR) repeat protein
MELKMAKLSKTKRKQPESAKLIEDPNELRERLTKTEEFLEKNRRWVFIIGGAIIVLITAFFAFKYYLDRQNLDAQANMFQAQYYFEDDEFNLALNGDGNNMGFLEIIDEYPLTEAANLAHFYAGVSFMNLGQFEDALHHLRKFRSRDLLVRPRAHSLIGDAYMELNNYRDAARFYNRAADYKPNKFFTPIYLMKGALAHELDGNHRAAMDNLETLVNDFADSDRVMDAKKELARLRGEVGRN